MKRWTAVLLVMTLMLLYCFAMAEPAVAEWGIFDSEFCLMGSDAIKNADQVLQRDLFTGTVNGMAFTVTEAGYDGRSLFLRYSWRIPEAKNAFGVKAEEIYGEFLPEGMKPGSYTEGLTEEGSRFSEAAQVGWWYDQFWIDGKGVNLIVGANLAIGVVNSWNPGVRLGWINLLVATLLMYGLGRIHGKKEALEKRTGTA